MRDHVGMMEDFGDYTSAEILRRYLEDLEEHAHHFEHYLEDDTLVLEGATH
jgi:bacterioferritin (cytochrome b1)